MINCLFLSCHAALEYYMFQLFEKLNISIPLYDVDIYNDERPKIWCNNVDIKNFTSHRHWNYLWKQEELESIDFIYIMNLPNVYDLARYYSQFHKPVIVHLFGQYHSWFVKMMIDTLIECPEVHIVCYSITEFRMYHVFTAHEPQVRDKIFYIPFGLDINEFSNWEGGIKQVYTTSNDYPTRFCCHYEIYKQVVDNIPHTLSGRGTSSVGGLGLLLFNELRQNYRQFRCYFTTGTEPAPYTLTPLEAIMTGCPTAIWDNKCGLVNEEILPIGLGVKSENINIIREYFQKVLSDDVYAQEQSEAIREHAIQTFNIDVLLPKWKEVIDSIF